MEKQRPTVGEEVSVNHGLSNSLAKIIKITGDSVRLRYEGWMPHDRGEKEFDLKIEDLSQGKEEIPWFASHNRTAIPSPELLKVKG